MNVPNNYSSHSTSVYHPESQRIYFFGGQFYDVHEGSNAEYVNIKKPLSNSLYYHVPTNTWNNQSWGGQVPFGRKYHTTTLCKSTPY
jgi:hypothetical protein